MFSFLTPLAFLGLLSLPGLALIYILRRRLKRHVVSSVILWKGLSSPREGGSRVEHLQIPLIFFLELLIIILLAMAAAGPMVLSSGRLRPLTVILDDSVSMRATDNNVSFRDKAVKSLDKILEHGRFKPIRFILAGSHPAILRDNVTTETEAMTVLEGWRCLDSSSHIEEALTTAKETLDKGSLILVITDKAPPISKLEPAMEWHAFGNPLSNACFLNAVSSSEGAKTRYLIELCNFSAKDLSTKFRINNKEERSIGIESRGRKRMVLETDDTVFSAELPDDALKEDNKVILYPAPVKKVGILITLSDEKIKGLIEKAVKASGVAYSIPGRTEVIFTDVMQSLSNGNEWVIHMVSEKEAAGYKGPFVIDNSHPLLKGISFDGVIWGAGKMDIPGIPIVSIGDIPVLTDAVLPSGSHEIYMRLNPELSTLQKMPAFPCLIWNILNWRASKAVGLSQSNIHAGSELEFIAGNAAQISLTFSDADTKTIPVIDGAVTLRPEEPGIYVIKSGDIEFPFAVNMISQDESDLSKCSSGKWGEWKEYEQVLNDYFPLAWIFILIALGGLMGHALYLTRAK